MKNANEELRKLLDQEMPADVVSGAIGDLRRGPVESTAASITLLEDGDGVLHWRIGDPDAGVTVVNGRRAVLPNTGGSVVWDQQVPDLGTNTVTEQFQKLDRKLNNNCVAKDRKYVGSGQLRELLADNTLVPTAEVSKTGPILVIVHGTFSKTEALLDDFGSHQGGRDFLTWARTRYKQILAFDHPTLSVSPFLNAMELAGWINTAPADVAVDVICHSRGGNVVRWWLEALDTPARTRRAIMVACPLGGTSLAAPDRLRNGLDFLTNVVRATGKLASIVPVMSGITGLMSIAAGVTGALAHTPAIDAIFAMVPGISAMSRSANNSELAQQFRSQGNPVQYFGVRSNFAPPDVPLWKFWKLNANSIFNSLADNLVFEDGKGNPIRNDLVVDCETMSPAGLQPWADWLDIKTSATIHHTNYFAQPEVTDFLVKALK